MKRRWFGRPREPWRAVWAVRRDWPSGTHEFIGVRGSQARAERARQDDQDFWRRSPLVPRTSVVRISERDFALHAGHRRDCRAPDCPTDAQPVAELVNAPYRRWWSRRPV